MPKFSYATEAATGGSTASPASSLIVVSEMSGAFSRNEIEAGVSPDIPLDQYKLVNGGHLVVAVYA